MSADDTSRTKFMPTRTGVRRLFSFAATLSRSEVDGTRTIVLAHGFRIGMDDPTALAQHWLWNVEAQHPGFSLVGSVSAMEITRDKLATMDPAYGRLG
ncbi:hypothetical protein [Muricoccus nepalensis]|uniref:hypothetical protein n=1 Tax=Muricoccus nepalensis TaxID=1854500 RepID=UPI00112D6BE0|nr:hypothetical protein [Roseomonas nepalensis]